MGPYLILAIQSQQQFVPQPLIHLDAVWHFVAITVVVGVVAMAALQIAKDLTPLRQVSQRRWLEKELEEQVNRAKEAVNDAYDEEVGPSLDRDEVLIKLVALATAGRTRALFALPIEHLAGQLNAAARAVLDSPERHSQLLWVMAVGADPKDIRKLVEAPAISSTDDPQQAADIALSQTRVMHQVQRNLDALQVGIGFKWKVLMQSCAIGLSAITIALMLIITRDMSFGAGVLATVIGGLMSGFVATVARDLLASLGNARRTP